MEKSILQLSKESLTELSSLPHLKTEPKEKPKTKKKEGTAGRIGPATLPDKKKKPTIGDKTKERIKKHGGELLGAAGGAADTRDEIAAFAHCSLTIGEYQRG